MVIPLTQTTEFVSTFMGDPLTGWSGEMLMQKI